jgi:hypothetical protein
MLEGTLHPAAAIVTGIVRLGPGIGAFLCLASARRRMNSAHRLRRFALGLLLLIPAGFLLWHAVRALLVWST